MKQDVKAQTEDMKSEIRNEASSKSHTQERWMQNRQSKRHIRSKIPRIQHGRIQELQRHLQNVKKKCQ